MRKTIFGPLVDDNETGEFMVDGTTGEWNEDTHVGENQFTDYVKRSTYTTYKNQLEIDLKTLEDNVDAQLAFLKSEAKLDYDGAVEISTIKETIQALYQSFNDITGLIWCFGAIDEDELPTGSDAISM